MNLIDKWFSKKEKAVVKEDSIKIETIVNPEDLLMLNDFCGQEDIIEFLKLELEVCKSQNKPLPHTLLTGPPGLGKTLLAKIISNELNAYYLDILGSALTLGSSDYMQMVKFFDLATTNKVLFIDEIHNLRDKVAETIYSAVQDNRFNGKPISGFTLVGATTYPGKMAQPLKDRMDQIKMRYYSIEELSGFVSKIFKVGVDDTLTHFIAKRSKGTPRLARKYARKIQDTWQYDVTNGGIDRQPTLRHATYVMGNMGINEDGFTLDDLRVLKLLQDTQRPLGKNNICATLGIDTGDYDTLVEPFLLRANLISIGPGGRLITEKGINYLNV